MNQQKLAIIIISKMGILIWIVHPLKDIYLGNLNLPWPHPHSILEGFHTQPYAPKGTLKVIRSSGGSSPRSRFSLAQILFSRGPALAASRYQPYRFIRLIGVNPS